jgi:hypothetical protein
MIWPTQVPISVVDTPEFYHPDWFLGSGQALPKVLVVYHDTVVELAHLNCRDRRLFDAYLWLHTVTVAPAGRLALHCGECFTWN